ncbi:hypothetical protein Ga0466249_001392 [Sporomusaceae bacterium BoRhaA]|uniref:hypothetical protein n=1 Tax=Pelorhabdus rhamnosifermentans TaxID=2772457 RepID=UPI001C061343|nr:hypothetical protein [Pelorhabdus rhamnosifermentans]MBU2700300.1 hypothetical protein [Pelorhabdus rhamnosifermentans]
MEELLKQILAGQKDICQRLGNLKQGQSNIEQGQRNLEQGQKNLEQKMISGFTDLKIAIDVTQKDVQDIRRTLRAVETITAKNWGDLIDLQKAE